MQWSDISFKPERRTLRQFAAIWTVFFVALAILDGVVRHRPTTGIVFGILALTIGPLGLVRPEAVRAVYVAWSVAAFPIGWTVSWIVLAALLYGIFTPIGFIFRLAGRDPLMRIRPRGRESYWTPVQPPESAASYFRQA